MSSKKSALVVCGFTEFPSKIESHVQPLANATERTTVVCMDPYPDVEGIEYREAPDFGFKPLSQIVMLFLALRETLFSDYDIIVSYSLIPYGMIALITKYLSGTPAHLGIIGKNIDVHAVAWYGPVIVWLFKRFDAITVTGSVYKDRLEELGVDPEKSFTLMHSIQSQYGPIERENDPKYDLLWLGRVSSEKDPILFVDTLAELRDREVDFNAALVGNGFLDEKVERQISAHQLENHVDTPGWADEPLDYYRKSEVYVLTSSRDMLPLTLLEAMTTGMPPIVSPVGAVPDLIEDGENGLIVEERSPTEFADEIESVLQDEETYQEISSEAPQVQTLVSYDAGCEQWVEIIYKATKTK
ncbi:glycosyltransferase family 4 protein [Natronococcus sp. A-GB1]|uniref:glycosyltransferase family 4 protein n=1 Tax=Natronococcus sp. A-GB1 TaxID=3037648 RepID=UPI00241CB68C|nr:glycosyltransferase family 4 protein [Natronococcus sp. A-GB1]MDG5761553.1 glycosyltransferase family 4 protein [Natronococcus sp. A-GB1]